jgi:hypothetical protein
VCRIGVAGYTVAMRRARLDGLHAAAIAAAASFVLYLPVYAMITGATLFKAPWFDVALQAVVQGVLTAIVALLLYGRMVAILGATSGAAFVAFDPSNDCGFGYSGTARMAVCNRLDGDRVDLARRLSGKRRAAPDSADMTAQCRLRVVGITSLRRRPPLRLGHPELTSRQRRRSPRRSCHPH